MNSSSSHLVVVCFVRPFIIALICYLESLVFKATKYGLQKSGILSQSAMLFITVFILLDFTLHLNTTIFKKFSPEAWRSEKSREKF